ncbi:MAG: hypothetical protein R3242_04645 [Akkermansiaceae bacterium]|nr:hypothetical protein [Akkermansiaceae bacterium]
MLRGERYWQVRARRLRTKINLATWLEQAAVPSVIAAGLTAALVLLLRHHWHAAQLHWQLLISTVPVTIALLTSWIISRRRFISSLDALVRLESRHGLNAALSTAHEGAGPWPPAPGKLQHPLRWRWMRTLVPTVLMLGLITTAWLLPVQAPATNNAGYAEPATWKLVETQLDELVEKRIVDKSSTEEARAAIEALRKRPKGEWFDHSSIEAGDRILRAQQRNMSELENRMRETARALREVAENRKGIQGAGPKPDAAFNELLKDLRMGGLTPDKELLDKLSELQSPDGKPLNQLDRRELAELLDRIEGNARQLEEMLKEMQGQAGGGLPGGPEGEGQDGKANGEKPGDGPGDGGPPLGNPDHPGLDPQQSTPLAAGDTSRSLPGDFLGEGEATHDVDPNESPTLREGGAAQQPGDGGSAVWRESLHPREQEALRRFFE